jgi:hypothetical protein
LGISFIININYIQLLGGIGEPVLESKRYITYIPMNWILHLREFLIEINATLEVQDLWMPLPQCQNDRYTMEEFASTKATYAKLVILNNWRLYYKVIFYSELCFSSEQGIQPVYLEYNHDPLSRQSSSNLHWQVQGKPDEKSFKIWRRFINNAF